MNKNIKQLLRESLTELSETNLSSQEEQILNDILSENLTEGIGGFSLDKLKSYARKGMLTAGVVFALMSNDAMGQESKQEVMNVAKTELDSATLRKIQMDLKKELDLEFDTSVVDDMFAVNDDGGVPFELPTEGELIKALKNGGLPGQFIDNIYVNYQEDATGNDHSAFKVSVRLKEPSSFARLKQKNYRDKVFRIIIKSLEQYKPNSSKGKGVPFNLDVVDPYGNIIGHKTLHFNG